MADEHLRELERRWSESESPDAEERYLRAALRGGAVEREAVARAAHLGHGPAQSALEDEERTATLDWEPWATVIAGWGKEACVRVGVAVARATIPWVDRFDGPDDRLIAVLQTLESWACAPSEATLAGVRAALPLIDAVAEERWNAYGFCDVARSLCSVVEDDLTPGRPFVDAIARVRYQGGRTGQVRAEVAAEVVPWLLGRSDALARRRSRSGRWAGHHGGIVRQLQFLPDGSLVVCSGSGQIDRRRFDPDAVSSVHRHRSDIYGSAASADGRQLVTGDVHGGLHGWDLSSGAEVEPQPLGDANAAHARDSVRDVAFLPDGRVLVGCGSGVCELWDPARRELLATYPGARRAAASLAVAPDGSRFLIGGSEGTLRLVARDGGAELRRWAREDGVGVAGVAILADGRRALVAWDDALLELLDLETGAQLRRYAGQARSVYGLAVSTDGQRLATVGQNGVVLWETAGARLAQWEVIGLQLSVTFAPNGDVISGARVGGLYRFTPPGR